MSAAGAITAVIILALVGAVAFYLYQNGYFQDIRDVVRESAATSGVGDVIPEFGEIVEEGEVELGEDSITFISEGEEVTYPTLFTNPIWNHMPIKFYMDIESGEGLFGFDEEDLGYVRTAAKVWEEKTNGIISFEETTDPQEAELTVSWFRSLTDISGGRVVGEGGPTRAFNTGGGFTLLETGEIFLIPTENKCVGVNRPVHEIGHVLALGHAPPGHGDIMFSKEISCNQNITQVTIDAINELYKTEAKPNLVFTQFSALKRGNLMNINYTVKNIGLVESPSTSVLFVGDGEVLETLSAPRFSNVPRILPGSGISNKITNSKVPVDLSQLVLIIDAENQIDEMDEENNEAGITFSAQ